MKFLKSNKIFLFIAICYLGIFFSHAFFLNKTVYGDGIYYYSWLRNAVVDHTIEVAAPGNKYSIGPAILWSPGFLFVHAIVRGTGYELPYQLAVGFMSVCYALIGLLLLYRFVQLPALVAIAGASNLLFYGSVDTVNSHALSFFAVCLYLSFLYAKQKNWFLIGACLSLITLIRPQDIILAILCFSFARTLLAKQGESLKKFVLGFFVVFSFQLFTWYATTGSFTSPYLTGSEGFDFLHPHILEVLFSPQNGLFLWTPIVLLGLLGLRNKLMIFVVLLQMYFVASWSSWNQGASFSGRMFVSVLPLIGIGLSNLFSKLYKIKLKGLILYLAVIFPLTLINMILIFSFLWKLS